YMDGYYGRSRSTAAPANGAVIAKAAAMAAAQRARRDERGPRNDYRRDDPPRNDARRDDPRRDDSRRDARATGPVEIPSGTQLNRRLTSQFDSKRNRAGDKFTAEVTTPGPYEGAIVEGHIDKLNQSGKVSGKTEMALAFDSITLPDRRSAELTASLEK